MTTAAASSPETPTGVGTLLREWRDRRRISQLELALRADSSARHISFIETGRSRPSQHGTAADRLRALPALVLDGTYHVQAANTVLSFLSTIATFNTPMDVTVSELAVETFLPADPETLGYLREAVS